MPLSFMGGTDPLTGVILVGRRSSRRSKTRSRWRVRIDPREMCRIKAVQFVALEVALRLATEASKICDRKIEVRQFA